MCLFYRSEYFHNCVIIQHLLPEEGDYLPKIALRPIVDALGPARIAALPGFHAWSEADVTGSFAGKEIVSISSELRFSLTRKGKVAMLEGIPRC